MKPWVTGSLVILYSSNKLDKKMTFLNKMLTRMWEIGRLAKWQYEGVNLKVRSKFSTRKRIQGNRNKMKKTSYQNWTTGQFQEAKILLSCLIYSELSSWIILFKETKADLLHVNKVYTFMIPSVCWHGV